MRRLSNYLSSWVSLDNFVAIVLIGGSIVACVSLMPTFEPTLAAEQAELREPEYGDKLLATAAEINVITNDIILQIAECQLILDDIILSLEAKEK